MMSLKLKQDGQTELHACMHARVWSVREKQENNREEKTHKLQSVFGSIVKPRETPQEPDRVAIAVALGL